MDEMEKIWKEMILAQLRYYPCIFPRWTEENHEKHHSG
jgi:hypothetical protein